MKWTTFSIFCTFYLALMLFAEHRPTAAVGHEFSAAYDLSTESTVLHAPAEAQANGWTAAQLPAQCLVASLVILHQDGLITLDHIAQYEKAHGAIAPGALVIADGHNVNFDFESVRFLAEGRGVYGLGAAGRVDFVSNAPFIAAKGMYVIENLTIPAELHSGAMVTIAPEKSNTAVAPARLLALERATESPSQ